MALPHGAVGWSALCHCGISLSYSLVFIGHSVPFCASHPISLHRKGLLQGTEINTGVCPRLEFDNIMFIICLWYDLYIYGAFQFLCNPIANL